MGVFSRFWILNEKNKGKWFVILLVKKDFSEKKIYKNLLASYQKKRKTLSYNIQESYR